MSGADVAQLKAYVAAPASGIQHRLDSTVLLSVSHNNLSARFMEIRLDLHVTVETLHASVVASHLLLTFVQTSRLLQDCDMCRCRCQLTQSNPS